MSDSSRKPFGPYLVQKVLIRTLLVIGIVVFGGMTLQRVNMRKDLTEDQRFTISEASHRIAAALDDQLTIKAYFTQEDLSAQIVPLYEQVRDVLEEYKTASKGKIKLEMFDPTESNAAKTAAEDYGIRPVTLMLWEQTARKQFHAWGSIVLIYQDKQSEVLNIAARYPEGYEGLSGLEYEISSRIWQLDHDKPTLGITGFLASTPPPDPRNPMGGRPQPEFTLVRRLLGDAFRIQDVDLNQVEPDPAKIPCLLIVRPKEFNDVQKFRLDQYVMKGGRAIFFVTQGELASGGMMGGGMRMNPFKTGLEEWFAFNGIRIPPEIVMHASTALPQQVRQPMGGGLVSVVDVPNPFRPVISRNMEECIDRDNPAVQPLRQIPFYYPHPVEVLEGKLQPGVEATVLVRSDERQSWRWKDLGTLGLEEAIRKIQSGAAAPTSLYSSNLIVALEGEFKSFYADNPVPPSLSGGDKDDGDESKDSKGPDVIKQSKKTLMVVVGSAFSISDGALMDPRTRSVSRTGREIAQVAFNLVDWLARAPELIKMRQKSFATRELINDVEDAVAKLEEEFQQGKITRDEYVQGYNDAQDNQKAEQSRWIWINTLVPILFVLVLGLLVWIVRVGRRSTMTSIPTAVPPEAASE